ncbi:MAG TPA: hypothetical protein VF077_11005, partial [Nitrospiraceae bacterium]
DVRPLPIRHDALLTLMPARDLRRRARPGKVLYTSESTWSGLAAHARDCKGGQRLGRLPRARSTIRYQFVNPANGASNERPLRSKLRDRDHAAGHGRQPRFPMFAESGFWKNQALAAKGSLEA